MLVIKTSSIISCSLVPALNLYVLISPFNFIFDPARANIGYFAWKASFFFFNSSLSFAICSFCAVTACFLATSASIPPGPTTFFGSGIGCAPPSKGLSSIFEAPISF